MDGSPDFEEGELEGRSSSLQIHTAHFQEWDARETPTPPKSALTKVPPDIVKLLPSQVAKALAAASGCHPPGFADQFCVNRNWDFMEFCSGSGRLTWWFMHYGFRGCAFDKMYGGHMDAATVAGLALAIVLLLRVKPGGLCFMAPECSTWVWIGRKQTGRSKDNVLGNSSTKVQDANRLNQATALLCNIASQWGVHFVVEQPSSSLFFLTDCMRTVIDHTGATRASMPLKPFGHALMKPTVLVGTVEWLPHLRRPMCAPAPKKVIRRCGILKETVAYTTRMSKAGKWRVTGKKEPLKQSAHYPMNFARDVVRHQLGLSTLSADEGQRVAYHTRVKKRPAARATSSHNT